MPPSAMDRIVILVDMDCFYCQVEEVLNPALKGKPIAVVQYNQWQGGGIIAVNYPAREQGVTRHMRGNEAQEKCPSIELVQVPVNRGKADISRYRNAGKRVADVLLAYSPQLERASVDEAYLDVTDQVNDRINSASSKLTEQQLANTHIVGFDSVANFLDEVYDTELSDDVNLRLAIGGAIAEDVRAAVFEKTGYKCSAGIAHNKILAKLVCGLHKPNQQTILPQDGVQELYKKLPVRKIQSMGGKFGNNVTDSLKIEYMGQLKQFSEKELRKHFDEKTSQWLYNLARGIENTPVTARMRSQSIGCCKKFAGPSALSCMSELRPWLDDLVAELHERLTDDRLEYGRRARHLVVNASHVPVVEGGGAVKKRGGWGGDEVTQSRSLPMTADWDMADGTRTSEEVLTLLKKCGIVPLEVKDDDSKEFSIRFLGLSAGKFEDTKNQSNISSFFTSMSSNKSLNSTLINQEKPVDRAVDTFQTQDEICNTAKANTTQSDVLNCNNSVEQAKLSCAGTSKQEKVPGAQSFFLNYFQNGEPNSPSDPNTEQDMCLTNGNDDNKSVQVDELKEASSMENKENKINCSDCKKLIALDEVQSHMDYHFAITLVRKEAHLYSTQNKTSPIPKAIENTKTKSKKRKSSDAAGSKRIDSFFTAENEQIEGATKVCEECGKRLPEASFDTHVDYHVAKRLAAELNTVEAPKNLSNAEQTKAKPNKKRKCDKNKSTKSISLFFKPT